MQNLIQLIYHNLNLVQEVCKVVLGVLVIGGVDCTSIEGHWDCVVRD